MRKLKLGVPNEAQLLNRYKIDSSAHCLLYQLIGTPRFLAYVAV